MSLILETSAGAAVEHAHQRLKLRSVALVAGQQRFLTSSYSHPVGVAVLLFGARNEDEDAVEGRPGDAQTVEPALQKREEAPTASLSSGTQALSIRLDQFGSATNSLTPGPKKEERPRQQGGCRSQKTLPTHHQCHIAQLETLMRMLDSGTGDVSNINDIKEDVQHYIDSCHVSDRKKIVSPHGNVSLRHLVSFVTKAVVFTNGEHVKNDTVDAAAVTSDPTGAEEDRLAASTIPISLVPTAVLRSHWMLRKDTQDNKKARSAARPTVNARPIAKSKTGAPMAAWNKVKSPPLTFHAVAVAANSKDPAGPPPLLTATLWERPTLQQERKCTAYDVSLKLWTGEPGMNRGRLSANVPDAILCGSPATPKTAPLPAALRGDSAPPSKLIAEQAIPNQGLHGHLRPSSPQRQSLQQTPGLQERSAAAAFSSPNKGSLGTFNMSDNEETRPTPFQGVPQPAAFARGGIKQTPMIVASLLGCGTAGSFEKLSIVSLFFAFYQIEGSKAQYLAAKALKLQVTLVPYIKNKTSSPRHEDPKAFAEDYDHRTYIHFDFENWCQKRVDSFPLC
ncbi:hypothetical protein HPB48_012263 [Haemaphysalis longicornis]|uniref:Uncharacterized protein n=1 Tax=Haemaphysalis longicornis TaxID=44386 RepID=A0A9J6GLX9_HAELO|nr:hypothetical protein HPB48_012263 [Haemaphysalis longicornis]